MFRTMHGPVSPGRQNCSNRRREVSVLQGCGAVGVCSALVTGMVQLALRNCEQRKVWWGLGVAGHRSRAGAQ